ncbi:unnamed protein product [Phytophthora lilii]|uniref:Unnamed protein product n=1 Tax=Phytophthora lilii TaxID=2077276 RepID=A0A9W6YJ56_9STRA|nr:unnamed protein product [Phytophthora lilii]
MTATIGFVGFGNMNSTMAEFAVKAGYRVILSNSRGPASLAAAVSKLGDLATAATLEDAVQKSDFVSVSIPFKNLDQLPFVEKIVIDSMDYYPERDDDPTRWALPIAGDHAESKAVVAKFMDAIGFDPVDCGSLSESWRIQQNTPGYCAPYVGEVPANATPRELYEWVMQDHSRVMKAADIHAMAASAVNSGRVGQLFSDFPSEYVTVFSMKFKN